MTIRLAHLREQGINLAVFQADARVPTDAARSSLLQELTRRGRARLKIDKAALQFVECGQLRFFGTPDLVDFLASAGGVHTWTHELAV